MKRNARYLKCVPSAKCLIEINTFPQFMIVYTDSHAVWSRSQQSVSLSSAEAELYALTTGLAEGMVTKHFTLDNILSRVAQAPQHALFFGVFGKTVISIHTDHV